MAEKKIKAECSFGMVWFAGWLFALGYLKLGFWKGVIALIVWPYFIGAALAVTGG